MKNIVVKVKKMVDEARLPTYVHWGEFGDLAADLYAVEEVSLKPGEVRTISTGIALEFPPGFGGIIADRSGLATRGFTTLGGVIDPGYRGELKVVATNLGDEVIRVTLGDRIAQVIILEKIEARFEETNELQVSDRAEGGFGSSGR